jgi:predicted PhzF superfamily epimerase YddE/YHI9
LLEKEAEADWMQAVAAEMNLSETAFVAPRTDGFGLRWFTPATEVDLCGHATLASAHVLWERGAWRNRTRHAFTRAVAYLRRSARAIGLNWISPLHPPGLSDLLGSVPRFVGRSRFDLLLELTDAEELRDLNPDFAGLSSLPVRGFIVTTKSDVPEYDFLSRFFAPAAGINEDPVTGSAHCALAPFWGERLGKSEMTAFQASARGGVVKVKLAGERVLLRGQAVTVLRGKLV